MDSIVEAKMEDGSNQVPPVNQRETVSALAIERESLNIAFWRFG